MNLARLAFCLHCDLFCFCQVSTVAVAENAAKKLIGDLTTAVASHVVQCVGQRPVILHRLCSLQHSSLLQNTICRNPRIAAGEDKQSER